MSNTTKKEDDFAQYDKNILFQRIRERLQFYALLEYECYKKRCKMR